jgi:hypothetical protein
MGSAVTALRDRLRPALVQRVGGAPIRVRVRATAGKLCEDATTPWFWVVSEVAEVPDERPESGAELRLLIAREMLRDDSATRHPCRSADEIESRPP